VFKYSFSDWSAEGPKFKTVKNMYGLTKKVRFGGPLAKAGLKDYLVKRNTTENKNIRSNLVKI
jgi:hypothetical protein